MIPGKDEGDKKAKEQDDVDSPLQRGRDAPRFSHYLHGLEQHERPSQVRDNPLEELSLFHTIQERGFGHHSDV